MGRSIREKTLMSDNYEREKHFVGTFQILDESLTGEILYNKKNGKILLSISKTSAEKGRILKSYGTLERITGKLTSGSAVTLFNNRCVHNSSINLHLQHLLFSASYMIFSDSEIRSLEYNKITCVLENAYEWSGLKAFKRAESGITLNEPLEEKTYHWFDATIIFSLKVNTDLYTPPDDEETKIIQQLVLKIESLHKRPLSWFIDIRDRVLALISFSIRDNVNVLEEYLYDYDEYVEYPNGFKDYKRQQLIDAVPQLQLSKTASWEYNLTLTQLPTERDINNALVKLAPIFNLYLSLFKYPYMPTEMVFLNIVQALETFHARFLYDNSKDKYVESVKSRFEGSPNQEKFFRLLLSPTQMDENCRHIILVSRLNDLLINTRTGLFNVFFLENENYAQTITDTRHYYTHYGKAKEQKALKGKALLEEIYVLQTLLEYHVCLVLGIDNDEKITRELSYHRAWQDLGKMQSQQMNNPQNSP